KMQISVGLGWEPRDDGRNLSLLQVRFDDMREEIAR
ncbi:MAG: hypothetical protein RL258_1719, partial [Pseudomonadota bacterium]